MKKQNPHRGSNFDDFLKEEGIFDEVNTKAAIRMILEQIRSEMKRRNITKTELARRMNTSRSHVDRLLLSRQSSANIELVAKAAGAVGKRLNLKLI